MNKLIFSAIMASVILFTSCFSGESSDNGNNPPSSENTSVISINPLDGATDVRLDSSFKIQFSRSLNTTEYGNLQISTPDLNYTNNTNCTMTFTTTSVSNDTVIIDPAVDFNSNQYTGIIVSGFKDAEGNITETLTQSNYSFSTVLQLNPQNEVSIISPFSGQLGILPFTDIVIQFNKSLDTSTYGQILITNSDLLFIHGTNCTMNFSSRAVSNDTVTLNPTTDFEDGIYSGITVSDFKDSSDNLISSYCDEDYNFRVITDVTSPIVETILTPEDGASDILVYTSIKILFNETLDTESSGTVAFELPYPVTYKSSGYEGNNEKLCDITFETTNKTNDTAVITPREKLDVDTYKSITISGFRDLSGNNMDSYTNQDYSFITIDTESPRCKQIIWPNNVCTNVGTNLIFKFTESMSTDTYGNVSIGSPSMVFINGDNCTMTFSTTDVENDTLTVDPDIAFDPGEYRDLSISDFCDSSGNIMEDFRNRYLKFTIISLTDDSISPERNSRALVDDNIEIKFYITMDSDITGKVALDYTENGSTESIKIVFENGINCSMTYRQDEITDDTLVIDPYNNLNVGECSGISVNGFTNSAGVELDFFSSSTYSFNADNEIIDGWDKKIDFCERNDYIRSMVVDNEGFIYTFGEKKSESWRYGYIEKRDKECKQIWTESISIESDEYYATAITTDLNNNVYAVGYGLNIANDNSGYDWLIKKFDKDGYEDKTNWNKNIDGTGDDYAYAIVTDNEGNVYVVGSGGNLVGSNTYQDWWIKKFDKDGNEDTTNWDKKFDGHDRSDQAYSVTVDHNENVYVAGMGKNLFSSSSSSDWWIKKFDKNGNEDTTNWNKKFNAGSGAYPTGIDNPYVIRIDKNNNVLIAGCYDKTTTWIKKFTEDGDASWNKRISGNGSAYSLAINNSNDVFVAGYLHHSSSPDIYRGWIKKFDEDGTEDTINWNKIIYDRYNRSCKTYAIVLDDYYLYAGSYADELVNLYSDYDWWLKKFIQ